MFLDVINSVISDQIWDIFSRVWFFSMLFIVLLMFFSKIHAWIFLKISSYLATAVCNVMITVIFTWMWAIPIVIVISIAGIIIINRLDVSKTHEQELNGGYAIIEKKRLQQIQNFYLLPLEKQEVHLKKVPSLEKMKIKVIPFLGVSAGIPVLLSISLKFVFNY